MLSVVMIFDDATLDHMSKGNGYFWNSIANSSYLWTDDTLSNYSTGILYTPHCQIP
jgi:hypothetical protein